MEREKNCVALVIIDYNMPGMNGIQLIRWTRDYFLNHAIPFKELPVFAFRAQQFYELAPDIIAQLNEYGVKNQDVIEKITNVNQMVQYFKKINYFYRTIAQN
jgi:CheY-like chemotaxis protein